MAETETQPEFQPKSQPETQPEDLPEPFIDRSCHISIINGLPKYLTRLDYQAHEGYYDSEPPQTIEPQAQVSFVMKNDTGMEYCLNLYMFKWLRVLVPVSDALSFLLTECSTVPEGLSGSGGFVYYASPDDNRFMFTFGCSHTADNYSDTNLDGGSPRIATGVFNTSGPLFGKLVFVVLSLGTGFV